MDKAEYIEQELEHMQVNSSECETPISPINSDIARLWCLHRGTPEFGRLVDQMIDMEVQKEAIYRGESRHEEKEGL